MAFMQDSTPTPHAPPPKKKISLLQSQEHFRNLKQNKVILSELLITLILYSILRSVTINH